MGISDKGNHGNALSNKPDFKAGLVNTFYLSPMIGNDSLGKSEYDVEIVKWIDGSTEDNGINKMILRPIEAGNMVELCRGNETQLTIASGTLDTVKVLKEEGVKRGRFPK